MKREGHMRPEKFRLCISVANLVWALGWVEWPHGTALSIPINSEKKHVHPPSEASTLRLGLKTTGTDKDLSGPPASIMILKNILKDKSYVG
jgi:hypothetical protein